MKSPKISAIKSSDGFTPLEKNRSKRLKPRLPACLCVSARRQAERSLTGFTLIEILVLIAIMGTLIGMGLFFTLDAYRGSLFRSEVSVVVNLLQKARNQAINNIGQSPHGVRFESDEYVLFHRDSYGSGDPTDEEIIANPTISVTGLSEVVFDQLTGRVDPGMTGDITVQYGGRAAIININDEGRIDW